MKNVINLIKLDYITVKNKSVPIIVIMIILGFAAGCTLFPLAPIIITMFAGLCIQPIFAVAEQCGYNKLYGVLPVKRIQIVEARFTLAGIFLLVTAAVTTGLGMIAEKIIMNNENFIQENDAYELLTMMNDAELTIPVMGALFFAFGCFFIAAEGTLIFIFGTSKEIPAAIGFGLVFFSAVIAMVKIFDLSADKIAKKLAPVLSDHKALLILALYAIGIALLVLGVLVSHMVTRKREL